jgi:hypothetical protein
VYLTVKETATGIDVKETEKHIKNDKYVLYNEKQDTIYPMDIFAIMIFNAQYYMIAGKKVKRSDCVILSKEDGLNRMDKGRKKYVCKSAIDNIVSPYSNKYPPFTKAVIMAVLKSGTEIALSQEDHDKKLALIREFNKHCNTTSEISIKKAEDLLSMFKLNLTDIFKPEYVK